MNTLIRNYFKKHTVASICGVDSSGAPFIFSCFYVLQNNQLLFKSNPNSNHIQCLYQQAKVGGTVIAQNGKALHFSGAQFEGEFTGAAEEHGIQTSPYYMRHPVARAIPGVVYAIRVTGVKLSENTLGMIRKHVWTAGVEEQNQL
ncbi:MAG TPA: hypothetical protein DEU93_09065 [Chitinophagaceae bacterium]|nr:hypothetical protein [Chitinophagaceae bacterium]HML58422.1 hypothetical protein [Ferruginibacter sp.]